MEDAEDRGQEGDSFDEIDYDAYFQDYIEYGYNPRMSEEHEEFRSRTLLTRPPDLADHLTWQLRCPTPPVDQGDREFIIGNIDEDGYLRATREEIVAAFEGVDPADIERRIQSVQSFDPIGVGAREPARVPADPARLSRRRRPDGRESIIATTGTRSCGAKGSSSRRLSASR
jgi:RNA polymerase sigma-54 factor